MGCFIDGDKPQLAPCDDDTEKSVGSQTITLDFTVIPPSWLGLPNIIDGVVECNLFDIFATAGSGANVGTFQDAWSTLVFCCGDMILFVRSPFYLTLPI